MENYYYHPIDKTVFKVKDQIPNCIEPVYWCKCINSGGGWEWGDFEPFTENEFKKNGFLPNHHPN